MISPSVTISRFSFGISRPMTLLPGITSTMRTDTADSARAMSFDSPEIWLTFTPGAGRSSKRVTTGPGCTATTSTSTPKSRSLISTSRDIASSASGEWPSSRGGGSSSSFSAGSSLDCGRSNSGTCFSFSTRSLFSIAGFGVSIRGGGLNSAFFFSSRIASLRTSLASRPTFRSLRSARNDFTHACAASTCRPVQSMIVSHDTPRNSETPANHSASSSSVAPRKLNACDNPWPTRSPRMPPAEFG